MLQAIREKAQGWIAWVIVIFISIPFALWGIQEYLGVGGEPKVAVVDGDEITQRMLDRRTRDFRESLRASLGDAYRADLFEDTTLKAQVREAMIEERVLVKHAHDWNLRTADGQARGFIASIPAFQRDGRFDQQLYDAAVRNRGMSAAGFEESVRQDMAVGQLRGGIRDTAFVTDHALREQVRLSDQTRTVRHVRIPVVAFRDEVVVNDDALRSFYEANPDRYRTPEQVRLAYLVLDAAELGQFVEVDEPALRDYFSAHRAEFVAREERALRHILVAVTPGADESAEQAAADKAAALLDRLRVGEDFAALAQANSDDPGSASNGGDLGWVEKGLMVAAFEEAAFALDKAAISAPVRTEFGYHIIQATDIRGGSGAGFEDLRDQVEESYRRFEAENLYFDYAERLAESAYENAASLTPAAEMLGLVIQESDWFTRAGMASGVLGSPRVTDAAFSDDVLLEGNNSDLIEVGNQRAVVVRILEHQLAGVKPFDENRALVEQDLIADSAATAAQTAGAAAVERLSTGETTLVDVAGPYDGAPEGPQTVRRDAATLPPGVVSAAFAVEPPAAGASAVTGVAAANGDYFVIVVDAVVPGDPDKLEDEARVALAEQMVRRQAEGTLRHVVGDLRKRTEIELLPIGD